jgi:di- and tripeptidase
VKAQVSLRIVPDQDLDTIVKSLCDYLSASFDQLHSTNTLRVCIAEFFVSKMLIPIIKVNVEHTADWWLGSLDDPWFKALESAVQEEWGSEPLRIREGGVKYPSSLHILAIQLTSSSLVHPFRSLPREGVWVSRFASSHGAKFGRHQRSYLLQSRLLRILQDQAHLPDERISLANLQKGKAVIERFILKVAA